MFALEILHRRGLEYYEALMPAVIGSLAGYAVYVVITGVGLEPVWRFPAVGTVHGGDLAWGVACGVVGAAVAAAFTYLNQLLRIVLRRLPAVGRPVVGGLALALLAWMSPYALTFGEAQLGHVSTTDLALRTLGAGRRWPSCWPRASRWPAAGRAGSSSRCSSWAPASDGPATSSSPTPTRPC